MRELFNEYVKSITTYIMFKIKANVSRLRPELEKKKRKPILLSMGAPMEDPPKYMFDVLKKSMSEKGIHTYSSPKGEKFFLDAIASDIRVICKSTPSATFDNSFKNKFLFKSSLDSFMISTIIKHHL